MINEGLLSNIHNDLSRATQWETRHFFTLLCGATATREKDQPQLFSDDIQEQDEDGIAQSKISAGTDAYEVEMIKLFKKATDGSNYGATTLIAMRVKILYQG